MDGTTIRIAQRDKLRLKALSNALGKKSLGATLSVVIEFVEKKRDELLEQVGGGKEEPMLTLLKDSGDYGKTNARKVDEYLYGEEG